MMNPGGLACEQISKIQYKRKLNLDGRIFEGSDVPNTWLACPTWSSSTVGISQQSAHETSHYAQTAHQALSKMGLHPFPEDTVIKSCIMHAHYNDIHNEYRDMVLCGGQSVIEMGLELSQWGHHGNNNVAGTADQFRLARLNSGLTNLYPTNW